MRLLSRGAIEVKGKGRMVTHWLLGDLEGDWEEKRLEMEGCHCCTMESMVKLDTIDVLCEGNSCKDCTFQKRGGHGHADETEKPSVEEDSTQLDFAAPAVFRLVPCSAGSDEASSLRPESAPRPAPSDLEFDGWI